MNLFKTIQEIGFSHIKNEHQRLNVRVLNYACAFGAISSIPVFIMAWLDSQYILVSTTAIACIICLIGLFLNQHGKFIITIIMLSLLASIYTPIQIWIGGNTGIMLYLITGVVLTSFLSYEETKINNFLISLCLVSFIICIIIIKYQYFDIPMVKNQFPIFMTHAIAATLGVAIAIGYFSSLFKEQQKSLAELNVVKDKMISVITHDLRGPIGNLLALLELSDSHAENPKQTETFMKQIKKELTITSELMEDVLNWVKGQVTEMKPNKSVFDAYDLVQNIIKTNQRLLDNKGIHLKFTGETTKLFADREMILLSIRNIISNAIKFSPAENGEINIQLYSKGKFGIIQITDNGKGIPEDKLALIAKKESFTSMGTEKEKGFGLGLILTIDFIEKNGGSLEVESKNGNGASFKLKVPLV